MNISASYYSAIGGRENNEDAVSLSENDENIIGMVADGLGGHENGKLASKITIKTINSITSREGVSSHILKKAIEEANKCIISDSTSYSMKSTIAVVWFDEKDAIAANVGDTRIYQFRNKKIVFQSRDHSVAQMSFLAGDITEEEIRTSKERHTLTRALGGQEEVRADIVSLNICKGDAILLCSDGFWERIDEKSMIEDLVDTKDAGVWLSKMKSRFCGFDGVLRTGDNHSAVAIIIL